MNVLKHVNNFDQIHTPPTIRNANLKVTHFVMEVGTPPSRGRQRSYEKCKLGSAHALSITV